MDIKTLKLKLENTRSCLRCKKRYKDNGTLVCNECHESEKFVIKLHSLLNGR